MCGRQVALALFALASCLLAVCVFRFASVTPDLSTARDPSRTIDFAAAAFEAHPKLGHGHDGKANEDDFGPEKALMGDEEAVLGRVRAALRIPTVSHTWARHQSHAANRDCWEWENFGQMLALFRKEYSAAFAAMEEVLLPVSPERAATLANNTLVLKWVGSDPALRPALLMGHYDVVPIEDGTADKWEHAPFSAALDDGGYIYARGTIDDKINVLTILEAANALAKSGWKPQRSLFFAFGHDEEVSGWGGAAVLAEYFQAQGERLEFVVDEGGAISLGVMKGVRRPVAVVGIVEKGYISLELKIDDPTLSGHSSMPPIQTVIGVLSAAVARVETSKFPASLPEAALTTFTRLCPDLPALQRFFVANLWLFRAPLEWILSRGSGTDRGMVQTTVSPTMIHSGNKENVLPRSASATVNFRIKPGETIASVTEHVRAAINDDRVRIEATDSFAKEASHVSRVDTLGFETLQGVIQDFCPECAVVPYVVGGATDSRYFDTVSDSVYRFSPIRMEKTDLERFHGTNERVHVNDVHSSVAFWIRLATKSCGHASVAPRNPGSNTAHEEL